MSLASLLVFCAVYAAAVATPGPGVAAIVARVLGRGLAGAPAFIAGFLIGDLVWLLLALTGLSFIANTFGMLFNLIRWAGVAWLLWIAWSLWRAPATPVELQRIDTPESPLRLFLSGLALTLGNPKVMVFFLAILPTVVDLGAVTLAGGLTIAAAVAVILVVVLAAYALLAERARRFVQSPRATRIVNRVCGVTIAGAAAAIAAR